MKKAFGEYRRLARGAFSCSSLWAGKEHLLYVHGTGFLMPMTEDYRRVRYRDVQVVTVARTRTWLVMNLVAGILLLLSLLPLLTALVPLIGGGSGAPGEEAFSAIVVAVFGTLTLVLAGMLVWNLVRGRTCRFGVQTANGTVVVRAANRVRVADRVLGELVPLIEASQGGAAGSAGAAEDVETVGVEVGGE